MTPINYLLPSAHVLSREWRVVARAAGIPDTVWDIDARSGAISDAEDARVALDEISGAVGRTLTPTTKGYIRGAIGKSRKVAELRQAHRKHDVNKLMRNAIGNTRNV